MTVVNDDVIARNEPSNVPVHRAVCGMPSRKTNVDIGRHVRLRRTIVDKWNVIPDGTVIGYDAVADRKRFTVSESGIVVVEHGHAWD